MRRYNYTINDSYTFNNLKDDLLLALTAFKVNGVHHGNARGREAILEWQDMIGTQPASFSCIAEIEDGMSDEERRQFLFVNLACLDPELATTVFMRTAGRRKLIAQHEVDVADLKKLEDRAEQQMTEAHAMALRAKVKVEQADNKVAEAEMARDSAIQSREEQRNEMSKLRTQISELEEENERLTKTLGDYAGLGRLVAKIIADEKGNE